MKADRDESDGIIDHSAWRRCVSMPITGRIVRRYLRQSMLAALQLAPLAIAIALYDLPERFVLKLSIIVLGLLLTLLLAWVSRKAVEESTIE